VGQLTRDELEAIVARDLPGYRLADQQPAPDPQFSVLPAVPAEDDTPDIETLRRKFLGPEAMSTPAPDTEQAPEDVAEDLVVAVQPAASADPWSGAGRAKTVVISGREQRVIGSQG
jgi:hypothetical protein